MEKQLLLVGIIALLGGIVIQSGYFIKGPDDDIPPYIFDTFRQYVSEFDKEYSTPEERSYRLHVFYTNTLKLQAFQNDKEADYTLGYTIFSDYTEDEYQSIYLMTVPRHTSNELYPSLELDTSDLLDAKDWRNHPGLIIDVFFQGACASQWATAIVNAGRAQFGRARYTKEFSIQQILDCTSDGHWNQGCKGGSHADAAKWILENGVLYENEYPYEAIQNPKCKKLKGGVKPKFFSVKKDTTGAQLKKAVNLSPVSVCFNASQLAFYTGGIINKNTEGPVNTCGILIGYDADGWIIQQSFGVQWGDNGYLHLSFSNIESGIYESAFYADDYGY